MFGRTGKLGPVYQPMVIPAILIGWVLGSTMQRYISAGLACLLTSVVVSAQPGYVQLGMTDPRFTAAEQTSPELVPLVPPQPGATGAPASATLPQGGGAMGTLTGEGAAPSGGAGGGGHNNGTNPAAPATTFAVQNEYFRLKGGDSINTVSARFKFPWLGGKGGVTLDIPFVYYDLSGSAPNVPHIGGLGDVSVNSSYNFWSSEDKRLTVVGLFNAYVPTADNLLLNRPLPEGSLAAFNLGTGKFVLAPGVAVVYAFAPNFFVAPVYLFEGSAWGNAARPDIRRGKFRLFAMYAWESGVYLLPEFQALTNYRNGGTDFYLAPELGYSFKGTTLQVKPGFGLGAKPGEREWGLSFGAKINF